MPKKKSKRPSDSDDDEIPTGELLRAPDPNRQDEDDLVKWRLSIADDHERVEAIDQGDKWMEYLKDKYDMRFATLIFELKQLRARVAQSHQDAERTAAVTGAKEPHADARVKMLAEGGQMHDALVAQTENFHGLNLKYYRDIDRLHDSQHVANKLEKHEALLSSKNKDLEQEFSHVRHELLTLSRTAEKLRKKDHRMTKAEIRASLEEEGIMALIQLNAIYKDLASQARAADEAMETAILAVLEENNQQANTNTRLEEELQGDSYRREQQIRGTLRLSDDVDAVTARKQKIMGTQKDIDARHDLQLQIEHRDGEIEVLHEQVTSLVARINKMTMRAMHKTGNPLQAVEADPGPDLRERRKTSMLGSALSGFAKPAASMASSTPRLPLVVEAPEPVGAPPEVQRPMTDGPPVAPKEARRPSLESLPPPKYRPSRPSIAQTARELRPVPRFLSSRTAPNSARGFTIGQRRSEV